jgi:hypothetical protein
MLWSGNVNGRYLLWNIGVDGGIILQWVLGEQGGSVWLEFTWPSGGLLWVWYITFMIQLYIHISLRSSCTMLIFIIYCCHMFQPYILAIFRELQVWMMCTALMATGHRWLADCIHTYIHIHIYIYIYMI